MRVRACVCVCVREVVQVLYIVGNKCHRKQVYEHTKYCFN